MENEHVINGLVRKRQEIAAEIDAAESRLRQLILDIDAVDATLRLFQPDIDLAVVRVRPTPRRHEASRGDSSRLILTLLREAGEPLTRRDIVSAVMQARGLNQADRGLLQTMRDRIGASLKGLRQRGRLVTNDAAGAGVRWGSHHRYQTALSCYFCVRHGKEKRLKRVAGKSPRSVCAKCTS